ncbi:hypothetical protein [Salinibacter ruber]|uniref:Uncharacterized protein n=1 Tax=Salinibacter ruber TaxID=146919 RepID=A0A9X2U5A1_9BACT|nr:hypothetical protein [Salinibacter ruber]MCS3860205.1 hypothetical protein [Salinibacter ruber]MCS3867031.1 hypothetical protein [Salinibacter ruber]MCS4152702.1 hypothetical protein [Salinibacter ruber]MCS4177839.1 hypothetical protein [Salinibacter ruber]
MRHVLPTTHALLLIAVGLVAISSQTSCAQPEDHKVTVDVATINAIEIGPGIEFNIGSEDISSGPDSPNWVEGKNESDKSRNSADLVVVTNATSENSRKITVSSSLSEGKPQNLENLGLRISDVSFPPSPPPDDASSSITQNLILTGLGSGSMKNQGEALVTNLWAINTPDRGYGGPYVKYEASATINYDPDVDTKISVEYTLTQE